jgi:hypothetical protein
MRPSRAEPLAYLAAFLRERGRCHAAYPFALAARTIGRPEDILFIDESVYTWRALDEFAVSAYWVGAFREALQANEELLGREELPASERARVLKNIAFCRAKLG